MPDRHALKRAKESRPKNSFTRRLPKLVALIVKEWNTLCRDEWGRTRLEKLYLHVRHLEKLNSELELDPIEVPLFSLEVYLSSFVDDELTPNGAQCKEIAGLIRSLQDAAGKIDSKKKGAATAKTRERETAPPSAPETAPSRRPRKTSDETASKRRASPKEKLNAKKRTKRKTASPREESRERKILRLIHSALADDGFQIRSCPMTDLQGKVYESFEISIRMLADDGNCIEAAALCHAATQAGLMGDVDRWMIKKAISVLDSYRQKGLLLNLLIPQCTASLHDDERLSWLKRELRTRHLVGTGLILKFNLKDLSADLDTAKHVVSALEKMGIAVAIAHFPAKPAAYKVLRHLNAQYIEITKELAHAEAGTIREIANTCRRLKAGIIVPTIHPLTDIDQLWSTKADLVPSDYLESAANEANFGLPLLT